MDYWRQQAWLYSCCLALFMLFGFIWVEGSHYIQEPNIIVLITETAGIAAMFGFALYNLVRCIRRFTGFGRLSNYLGGDTSYNGPYIGFYINGGKGLNLVEVKAVAEIVAESTEREISLVNGVAVSGDGENEDRSLAKAYMMVPPQ